MRMLPSFPRWEHCDNGCCSALADYVMLMKPRISLLVLLTVSAGFALGSTDGWHPLLLAQCPVRHCPGGDCFERVQSMARARQRCLDATDAEPSLAVRRLSPAEVLLFGLAAGILGIVWLAAFVGATTAVLSAVTLVLYVGVYTPLKRRTSFGTAVGAIPGAMPPVLGWAAAGAPLDAGAFSLFAVLFLWQFPHFLAIAWIYREQYARAGLKMLPASRPNAWRHGPDGGGIRGRPVAPEFVPGRLRPGWKCLSGRGAGPECGLPGGGSAIRQARIVALGTRPVVDVADLSSRAVSHACLGPFFSALINGRSLYSGMYCNLKNENCKSQIWTDERIGSSGVFRQSEICSFPSVYSIVMT